MKLNHDEKKTLSDAIDQLTESLDAVISLYNESEEDREVIVFDEDCLKAIERAKEAVGEEEITKRINTIIKEVLSLLSPLPKE